MCTFNHDKPAASSVTSVCYPGQRKVNVPAVTWGEQNEDKARSAFVEHSTRHRFRFSLERACFVINLDIPYMGASLDGIVNCYCRGRGCLEVKCPYSYKHHNVTISDSCRDPGFCPSEEQGVFTLRTTHPCYYQVQCQMLVSKTDYCCFFCMDHS